jgi:Uma2 family endonuclease
VSTITKPTGRVSISVEEFRRMQDAGLFEGRHVELLDGELFEVTKKPPHNYAVDALAEALRELLPRGRFRVREEKSIEPWAHWSPEPDIAVVRGPKERYRGRHPGPADIVLLAEVCETSPQDRTVKLAGYAEAEFPVYWILDLGLRRLEVYSGPIAGEYPAAVIRAETESVDVVIEGQVVGQIAVADLLP